MENPTLPNNFTITSSSNISSNMLIVAVTSFDKKFLVFIYNLAKKKSEAHDVLSFQWEVVPNVMVMDGTLEQVQGKFHHKCRQAAIHVKQTEPHMPWLNTAESAIRELQRGLGCKMSSLVPPDASGIIVWRENRTFALTPPLISLVSMVKFQRLWGPQEWPRACWH